KISIRVDIQSDRELALRVGHTEQTLHQIIAVGASIRQPCPHTVEHVANTTQRAFDRIGRISNEIGAKFYRAKRSASECLTEGFGLGHFFKGRNSIELVQAQLGELDTVKGVFAVWRIDIENAHHAVTAHDRSDRVIRAGSRLAKIFLD